VKPPFRLGWPRGDLPTVDRNGMPLGVVAGPTLGADAALDLDLDGADALVEDDALDDLDGSLADEEALQEIAEQTPYGEILLEDLIRRQLRLGVSVAAAFLVILLGLPLMNLGFPSLMQMPVLGLPMAWLALAILVYPFVWVLAWYFVTTSRKYEDEFTELVK
jgi:uncharacterized membrane protein (DUF485 family)